MHEPTTKADVLRAAARSEGCLGRSAPDEPVFVLVARDVLAADKVRAWALALAARHGPAAKVASAYALADAMDRWREQRGDGGKLPD